MWHMWRMWRMRNFPKTKISQKNNMIYQATKEFPFEQLTLVPSTVLNGNFFTKYLINEKPLYIQSPKCFSKNGLVKTGKRMFCDLIFLRENEQFIQWIEHLETFTQKYIFDNREKWFETTLEMTDIEDSFTQIMKSYKSGKNYLIRTNVSTKPDGACSLKIYDENENNIDPESITDKTEIMTILEIQGVKCSSKSFQIEIEIKQMMVLNQIDPFEKCVFKTSAATATATAAPPDPTPPPVKQVIHEKSPETEKKIFSETSEIVPDKINLYDTAADETSNTSNKVNTDLEKTTEPKNVDTTSLNDNDELCEVEFDLEELPEEKVQIKNRNDVYYEMYKEAKRKAKIARDLALSSYLEAKRIKNTYMLDDIDDDSDDSDDEDDDEDGEDGGDSADDNDEKEEINTNQKE